MNKKQSSNKQEKMVADYMGWKVVTGSGSRPFNPGDVNGYNFLVECKTHIEEQVNIVFYKKHWKKISEESLSKHRYPVLITDNGTQRAANTWVMLPKRMISDSFSICQCDDSWNKSRSNTTITFEHRAIMQTYRRSYSENNINYIPAKFDDEELAIMPLDEFRNFCMLEFGA